MPQPLRTWIGIVVHGLGCKLDSPLKISMLKPHSGPIKSKSSTQASEFSTAPQAMTMLL